MGVFVPTYFAPISLFSQIYQSNEIIFEVEENFQKQSYRNRCYIYGANGKQMLNIPVKKNTSKEKQKTKDTRIENSVKWQDQHFKSLKASYNCSPFFEFYEDDLQALFRKKYDFLIDVNIDCFLFFTEVLQLDLPFSKTLSYLATYQENDFRHLADTKQTQTTQPLKYIQVFDDKHGFIPNLSLLDLLFMEGPNTLSFF
jgi:hypothetical protein